VKIVKIKLVVKMNIISHDTYPGLVQEESKQDYKAHAILSSKSNITMCSEMMC
jgi:hypothetical protein